MELGRSYEQKLESVEQLIRETPEIAGLQAYEYFRNNNVAQKADFISGERAQLDLTYPELGKGAVNDLANKTQGALLELATRPATLKNETLFRSVEYRFAEMYMLSMSRRMQDQSLSAEDRAEATQLFKEANEALYGLPELGKFNVMAERSIFKLIEGESNQTIRQELAERLGTLTDERTEPFKADQATVDTIHSLVVERFSNLIEHISGDTTYTATEIKDVFETGLDKLGGADTGWEVVMVPNAAAISVSAHRKLVEIGENRVDEKGNVLAGIMLHELGVHVDRSIRAEKAGYLAAAYGMDGYLDFEEALGSALEAAYAGKFADKGQDYYLVAGLAYGYDNHAPRNFRETYEILWRQKALKKAGENELTAEEIVKSQSAAFTTCMRMFRGTDTKTPGVIYLKDLSYSRGKELVWNKLAVVKTQEELDIFFAGKIDLTQADHVETAKAILASAA